MPLSPGAPLWTTKNDLILNVSPGRSVAIPVTTTPRVEFGRPVEFPRTGREEGPSGNTRRNADAFPDGERFIGVTGIEGLSDSASRIVIVLNWFDEVRKHSKDSRPGS